MAQSLAERFRANRESFVLALELGCTPAEAAEKLRHRATVERCRAAEARLQAKMNGSFSPVLRSGCEPDEPRQPWWQRED